MDHFKRQNIFMKTKKKIPKYYLWYWIFKFMMKHSVKLTGSIEGPAYHRAWTNHNFKGTVSQIFKFPYMQTWQYPIYTGTQPLIAFLAGQVWIRYQCFCFLFAFSLRKWLAHSLLKRCNGETYRVRKKRRYLPHF